MKHKKRSVESAKSIKGENGKVVERGQDVRELWELDM